MTINPYPQPVQPEDPTGVSPVPNYPQGNPPVWPVTPTSPAAQEYSTYPPHWQHVQYQPYVPVPPVQLNVQQQNTQPAIQVKRDIGLVWHTIHLIMSVMTLGLWVPIWITHAIVGRRARR